MTNQSFNSMVQRVIIASNRPDMEQESIHAVQQATLYYHHLNFLAPDYKEDSLGLGSHSHSREFSFPKSTLTGVRRIVSITAMRGGCCPVPLRANPPLGDCAKLTNYYRNVGAEIKVKLSTPAQSLLVGYFANPVVDPPELYSSWVLDIYPNELFDCAMMYFYDLLNDPAQSDRYRVLVGTKAGFNGHSQTILGEQIWKSEVD